MSTRQRLGLAVLIMTIVPLWTVDTWTPAWVEAIIQMVMCLGTGLFVAPAEPQQSPVAGALDRE